MEKQQAKLLEAARLGSIASLHQLLRDDPLILARAALNHFNDTPLHVAAMLGHVEFVKEIVALKPELANELNLDGSSPLHLASAEGHVEAMKALLRVDTRACLLRDRNQMMPLHVAAAKGRVEAMQLLLEARPEAATEYIGGENILHLCVKRYQVEALRVMVESGVCSKKFLNSKDGGGNTVLHLAVAEKQVETVTLLVSVGGIEVNSVNEEGMTALDVLIRSRRDLRDSEIEKSLTKIAGTTSLEKQNGSSHPVAASSKSNNNSNNKNKNKNKNNGSMESLMRLQYNWLDKKKDALMVVASLIAAMAFQVGVNPPGGFWQDDYPSLDEEGKKVKIPHTAGESIYADKYIGHYKRFYITNAVAFLSSLSIVLLLTSGLPIRRRPFMWLLMVVTWVSISSIAYCYLLAIGAVVPEKHIDRIEAGLTEAVVAWMAVMGLLLLLHTICMIVWSVKKTIKACVWMIKKMRTRRYGSSSSLTRQNP